MEDIDKRLANSNRLVEYAVSKVEADWGASPALNAVMKELRNKSSKAVRDVKGAGGQTLREYIFELEQAAVSAKAAAESDHGLSDETRQAVLDAHAAYWVLKSDL
jgi:hypothetical protein